MAEKTVQSLNRLETPAGPAGIWAPGEPSFIDGDGTSEDYIILWNHDGGWRYWDSRGDLNEIWGWRDRVAYVCEFDN